MFKLYTDGMNVILSIFRETQVDIDNMMLDNGDRKKLLTMS